MFFNKKQNTAVQPIKFVAFFNIFRYSEYYFNFFEKDEF